MFNRKDPHRARREEPVAPPYMHNSDIGDDLGALLGHFRLQRSFALEDGHHPDDSEVVMLDAQIEACHTALVVVQVAAIAIERARTRGRGRG